MNSALAVSPATATIQHLPPDVHSHAAALEAIEWGECYGLNLDPDQRATLFGALGEREDKSWAAAEVADFKGRQAGKNDTLKVRQGAGIDLFGEKLIIHTAHEFPTANEDFLRLVALYENYDDLRAQVARIRYANGEQGIEFINGARIKYKARTGGSGRGFTKADLVVYDEAQHLQSEHLAASLPTLLANPNFQAWYCGSGGMSTSSKAWELRRRAIAGNGGRFAYTENTAQAVAFVNGRTVLTVPDELLVHEVLMCHPGYAHGRVSFEAMETMYRALGAEKFSREILCVWEPDPGDESDSPIPPSTWESLTDVQSTPISAVRVAFDVSPDRKWATFGLAAHRDDGLGHVEVRDSRQGTDWVVDRAAELANGHGTSIIIAAGSPGASFVELLESAGVAVDVMKPSEYAEACGRLIDATRGHAPILRHRGDPRLRVAIGAVQTKPAGDGGIVWSRKSTSSDITPLTTVTMAWGRVTRRDEPAEYAGSFASLDDFLEDD